MGKLLILMITAFVDMVGFAMVLPLVPFYATRMGATGFVIGLLISAFSIAQLLSAPTWGRVSDRFGRRPAVITGLLISAGADTTGTTLSAAFFYLLQNPATLQKLTD